MSNIYEKDIRAEFVRRVGENMLTAARTDRQQSDVQRRHRRKGTEASWSGHKNCLRRSAQRQLEESFL